MMQENDTQLNEEQMTLARYAEQAYLDYAVSVVKGRALPEISDGQKPVQRRILYAMHQMGLHFGAKAVKSARVVGDVLGKFHPHGDSAAYEAMVRMAQDFTLRYPLIDGQGNFGSRDGDGAAAMRYTEARLTPIASLLLDELGEGTVDFVPNYDGTQQEPSQLPARLPFMLLNGASGIAVGMATEIPSHNLRELAQAVIALIKTPQLTHAEVMQMIPGPDFSGGAQIITPNAEIADIYQKGKGTIKLRARWEFEELARGQWQLVVHELPPGTSCQKVLEEIESITNPKVKAGKKSLSADQLSAKQAMLALLDTVRDESGKDAAVRLVFEPKSSRIDRDEFVNHLLACTSMESNTAINLVCIGLDGRPAQRSLLEVLQQWVAFRQQTMVKRTQYRLDKVLDRIHVLEGRVVVYLNIDEVIHTIRESDEPKSALIARFRLTERQAQDILEMRLRQLARLEGIKIEQELAKQRQEAASLQHLLDKPSALQRLMIKEIESDAKQYGDERRTLIEAAQKATVEHKVVDEAVTVVISQMGWLRTRQGHGHDPQGFTFKTGDQLYATYECRTTDKLIVFGSDGRTYTIAVSQLPSARGDGQPLTAMIDLERGTQFTHIITGAPDSQWLLAQTSGIGFICRLSDMESRNRKGKTFVSLDAKSQLLAPVMLSESVQYIGLLTAQQHLLVIERQELKQLSNGGLGTILIALHPDDTLSQTIPCTAQGMKISGIYRNKATEQVLSLDDLAPYRAKRARKGKLFKVKMKSFSFSFVDES